MRRRSWRGHRDPSGNAAGPRQDGVPPGGEGGEAAGAEGWTAPAGGAPPQVPGWLQLAAGWSWRLLVVGVVVYLTFRVASTLGIVVLPFMAALLLTALRLPLTRRLRRAGLPALAATWCTVLAAVAVLAGAAALAATATSADYQTPGRELGKTGHDLQRWLAGPAHS